MGTPTGNFRTTRTLRVRTPAEGTAGTGGEYAVGTVDVTGAVVGARYTPDATVTGVASNNKALAVVNKGTSGSGTQSTAAVTFGAGTNAPAYDLTALTLDPTVANRDVVAGSVLSLRSTVNGTGMTLPAGTIEVDVLSD